MYFANFARSVRKRARQLDANEIAYTLTLTPEGVAVKNGKQTAEYSWDAVYRACRLKRSISLYVDAGHAFLMTGISRGGNSNFSNTMISTLPGERATRGYQLLHGAFAVGALLSPMLLVFCARRLPVIGWRVTAGVLLLLCIAQLATYARMPLPRESRERGIKSVDRSFLKLRQFWLGSAMLFFYISAEYAIVGWLVTYFQDVGVLDSNRSQLMNSLLRLAISCGRMIGAARREYTRRAALAFFNRLDYAERQNR